MMDWKDNVFREQVYSCEGIEELADLYAEIVNKQNWARAERVSELVVMCDDAIDHLGELMVLQTMRDMGFNLQGNDYGTLDWVKSEKGSHSEVG
jgi:hypothetical protein